MWAQRITGWVRLVLFTALACGGEDPANPAPRNPEPTCSADEECDVGRCDPREGCVDCLFDHDCPAGNRCDERECREILTCQAAEDCRDTRTPVCDENSQECVACLADADCQGTAHCVAEHCSPYSGCTTSADCSEGACDVERGECVECVTSRDCPNGKVCSAARCDTPCQSDRNCGADEPICGPLGFCVECATHTHCPEIYHCAAGRCQLDVCEGPSTHCEPGERGIATCAASGSNFTTTPCGQAQSCTDASGQPECANQVCEPEAESCDDEARYLELCSADGLAVASRVDCFDTDAVCLDGACVPWACNPNEFSCRDGDLYRCSDDGTGEELDQTCRSEEVCDEDKATCLAVICVPDAPACHGDEIRSCNDTGTGFVGKAERCDEAEACFEGACRPRVCISEYECEAESSFQCVDNGTRLTRAERCNASDERPAYCNPDTGRCELIGCEPSQPICAGDFATVCADDGSAPVAGGVDCTQLDQACFDGSCRPVLCTEEFVCEEGDLLRCEDNGTALRLQGECGRPALCDAEAGLCLTEVCTPSDPVCNGSTATTCDETGTGYEPGGTDCTDDNRACFDGACLPIVCLPDAHFCAEGDVQRCDETGTHSSLVDDCESGEHCVAGEATCVPNACSPDAPVCAGTVATTCRHDGSGPEAGGTDCALSGHRTCQFGECTPLVCEPNQRFCQNGHVRLCNDVGTNSGPYDTCLPEEHCDETDVAHCRADRCSADEPACSGEFLARCNADGSGYASFGTDCALEGEVCTLTDACASSATDTLGGVELSSQNPFATLYLTALEAFTPRTIVELAGYFAVPLDTEVVWLVYSSPSSTGNYTKQFELTTTASADAATYHASGPMSVQLESGHFYALGTLVRGPHTEYQSVNELVQPTSLGAVVGTMRTDTGTVPGEVWIDGVVGRAEAQRIVTEAIH